MLPSAARVVASGPHATAVEVWARRVAEELGLEPAHVDRIGVAARLLDVGMLEVPRAVLDKPGPLSAAEWELVHAHPEHGARMLADPAFDDVRPWVLFHHERPDGAGYPYGLDGRDVPREAAILGVADGWAAMTQDRPYRRAMRLHHAAEELRTGSGAQWDEACVEALLRVHDRSLGVLRLLGPADAPRPPRGAARAPHDA